MNVPACGCRKPRAGAVDDIAVAAARRRRRPIPVMDSREEVRLASSSLTR